MGFGESRFPVHLKILEALRTEELVQLDTGYSEELLIPQTLFEALDLTRWQLPDSIATQGTTVTGQIVKFNEAPVEAALAAYPRSIWSGVDPQV
ncbi:MAG: hypothetical protein MAG451_00051 [Anaerolineales bacterium]|nr:hypothetical protein [Anaerolineales bacterium]